MTDVYNFMELLTLILSSTQSSLSTRREGEEGESKEIICVELFNRTKTIKNDIHLHSVDNKEILKTELC